MNLLVYFLFQAHTVRQYQGPSVECRGSDCKGSQTGWGNPSILSLLEKCSCTPAMTSAYSDPKGKDLNTQAKVQLR